MKSKVLKLSRNFRPSISNLPLNQTLQMSLTIFRQTSDESNIKVDDQPITLAHHTSIAEEGKPRTKAEYLQLYKKNQAKIRKTQKEEASQHLKEITQKKPVIERSFHLKRPGFRSNKQSVQSNPESNQNFIPNLKNVRAVVDSRRPDDVPT